MTHAAIHQLLEPVRADVVLRNQGLPALELVRRCFPFRVKNLVSRAEIFLRRRMAIQTPTHIQRMRLPGDWHAIHRAVASGAADTFLHMNAVIEEDEIGKLIDPLPRNWLARSEAFTNGREDRRVLPDL